jgi:stage II sporulation protein AB (anti-sigma F factor)
MQACSAPDIQLELPPHPASVAEARQAVSALATETGAAVEDVALAVSEAVGNAVIHAFRPGTTGTIAVCAGLQGRVLVVKVADDGVGMRPDFENAGLGLGTSLITRLAKEARLESSDRGTTVTMIFELNRRNA